MESIQFELHKLGWKAFEDLVSCILKEVLGQTFQIFSDGIDGGRDGAFYGTWNNQNSNSTMSGNFTIQCKHTSKPETKLTKNIIKNEFPKIDRLAKNGLADVYLLFTNYSIMAENTALMEDSIVRAGAKSAKIYGAEWINNTIASNPRLRRMVPRMYGLGDLSQIITNQSFRQAKTVLESIAPDLACFVPTEAYRNCAQALTEHGFVMLIGEPASGKTMIANLLALSAADEWNLQTLILFSPEDLDKLWNPDDSGQFFWVDDAFGATNCDFNRVNEWNLRLPKLKAAIHNGARVIFTSRSYIFRSAMLILNTSKFELFKDSKVIIEVEKLSDSEKAMILYNHLKLGKQTSEFRKSVKHHLSHVVSLPKFLPEVARRFADPKFTNKNWYSQKDILNFFSYPTEIIADIIRTLAPAERAALALIFVNGGALHSPLRSPNPKIDTTILSMQSNLGDVKAALLTLDGSFIQQNNTQGENFWKFRHPTIRDAFATYISSNPELIDIYLSGVNKEKIITEISCGDMGIEGIQLIVPSSMFEIVLNIITRGEDSEYISRPIISFLASRCSVEFLNLFFENELMKFKLLNSIASAHSYDNSLKILTKLNKNNLLSEELRQKVLKAISSIAENKHSNCFINEYFVGNLITQEENDIELLKQKNNFYAHMLEIIDDIENTWCIEDDVDDLFYDVTYLLESYREINDKRYCDLENFNEDEWNRSELFIIELETRKNMLKNKQSESVQYDELDAQDASNSILLSTVSIFDDLDD